MHIRSIRLGSALAAGLFIAACGGNDKAPLHALDVDQPAGWDDDIALKVAEDINPDPDIVEINLEAKITNIEIVPGHPTPVWAYNGSLPGPLIRAKVGDMVEVELFGPSGLVGCPGRGAWPRARRRQRRSGTRMPGRKSRR